MIDAVLGRLSAGQSLSVEEMAGAIRAIVSGQVPEGQIGLLLTLLHEIERAAGRDRENEVRYGPRPLDLDILLYGDRAVDEDGLAIPHPRIAERAFVLVPLAEIAPELVIGGTAVRELLGRIDTAGVHRYDPL